MDTNSWSFDTGYCKIKTARQKKRLQKRDFDKQLIRVSSRQQELSALRQKLPPVPLKEPYQRGWKRTFVLREDIARSARAGFYSDLLRKINTTDYATNRSFKRRIKRKRNRKKLYEVKPQYLRSFCIPEWNRPGNKLSDEEKVHFYLKECVSSDGKSVVLRYFFSEPWRFVLRVRPNMITHARMVDEVLEQEIQALDNHITNHHLHPRMMKLTWGKSWRSHRFTEREKYKNPLQNKPLYRILDEAKNE